MKIKRLNLYTYILYIMLAAYMLGPALSFKVGVPRIDNPLTLIFVLLGFVVFFLESKHIPRKIFAMLCALTAMCIWPAIHMGITSLTPTQYMDILFFMAVPAFFYLFYQVLKRADDPLGTIQKFLIVFTLFIAVPPFAELATGIQFVSASDELAIDEGSLKGLFFNPNNLAATAVCLAPAILFFFQLQGRKHKEKLLGWGLFLLLGMAIFASVSRTAIGCYLLILLVYTAYRKNGFITVGVAGLLVLVLSMIPSRAIAEFLLSLNGNQFLERFSSRVYLFLYDLGSDNSVSYRQEIYNYFWNNPPLLLTGYGPKNFREYFGGHLSGSLGLKPAQLHHRAVSGFRHDFLTRLYCLCGVLFPLHRLKPRSNRQIARFGLGCLGHFPTGRFYSVHYFAYAVYLAALPADFYLQRICCAQAERYGRLRIQRNTIRYEETIMKIILTTSMSGLGGTENATFRLGRLLKQRGHDIVLASSDGPLIQEAQALGIRWQPIDFYQGGLLGYVKGMFAYMKLLKKEKPDVIHCQMARIVPACAIAAKFASPKTKVFYHARGLDPETYPKIAKLFDKLGVYIIGNCKHEREKLIRYGFPANRITYTYNALHKADFVPEKTVKDYVQLGTLSRLDTVRAVHLMLDILKKMVDRGMPVRLNVAGIGEEMDNLKAQAKRLGIEDKVTFLGGVRDLTGYFKEVDILVNTPHCVGDHGAGVGNNILEAGLYDTPVVTYNMAGISEMVITGQTGYCIPFGDDEAFIEAVDTLIKHPELRGQMGKALHKHVETLCSDDEIYRTTMAAYEM